MEEKKFDEEIYPLEKSMSGTNAFYIADCDVVGHTAAYCACLKRVADRQNGRLSELYASCGVAIDRKSCRAAKLRKEEIAAGKALYYISRAKLQAHEASENAAFAASISSRKIATPSMPTSVPYTSSRHSSYKPSKPASVVTPSLEQNGFAAAINIAMQEEAVKQKTALEVPEQKEVKPVSTKEHLLETATVSSGMSLLEIARQRINNQKEKQHEQV